jgi:PKD repeat protein
MVVMRTLGMCAVATLAACGNVPTKMQQADAAVAVDAPIDAFSCTGHEPDATFMASSTTVGLGQPVTFTATTQGLSYAWTFPSGNPAASAAASPVVMWSTAGTYNVSLSVSDANHCLASSSQMITAEGCAAALSGPATFDQMTGGHSNAGIVIVPNKNTTLTSFTVGNQSMADTINLTDAAGTILQALAIPANTPVFQASVSWPLTANTTYHLVTQLPNNGRWTMAPAYPVAASSLAVTAGWMDGAAQSQYWFSFQNLVTCP